MHLADTNVLCQEIRSKAIVKKNLYWTSLAGPHWGNIEPLYGYFQRNRQSRYWWNEILEIKATISPRRFFRNHRSTWKFCSVTHLVIIECLSSSRMSLASLYNPLYHFQSESVVQIPVTLRRKTIFDKQATISLKNRRFDEKSLTKSTPAGTHTKAQYGSCFVLVCFFFASL